MLPRMAKRGQSVNLLSLPISPMSLFCPWCKAEPWEACETKLGAELEVIHVERIKAAAESDAAVKRERRPTSLYEIESREADEELARIRKRKIWTKR
jgi:hypothetical protein